MDVTEQIKRYHDFIEKQYLDALYETVRKGENKLVISFLRLIEFDPELANDLLERPEECISAAEFAVREFDLPAEVKNFKVRFNELSESQKMMIRNIRSKHLTKLFHIEGIVRQKSDVRPQVTSAKFECPSCGNIISVLQLELKFREPSRCGCGRKGKFRELSKELIDAQRLVLEEAPEDLDGGEQPKRIGVFLKDDLVSPMSDKKTNPGNKVMVTGIVKEIIKTGKDGGKLTQFDLHIEANYIEPSQEDYYQMEITEEDEEKIKKVAYDPRVYTLISESIAPTIFGYDRVKEAIALQLVGGVKKTRKDGTVTRGDMHVLLIGDPGSGKSQLLKRTSKIAPKARYVSGKGVSGAGLTASVVKDEFLGGWSLEAGALPLANKGFCVAGETEIYMANGNLKRIDEIYNEFNTKKSNTENEVYYLNPKTYKFEKAKIVNVSKRTVDTTFKIETDTGQTIVATEEHPFAVWNNGLEWKEVKHLKENDSLFVPRHFPIAINDEKNDDLYYLLGLIATDGHLSKKKYTVSFYTSSPELKKDVERLSAKLFDKIPGCSLDNRSKHYHLFICSKKIHQLIESYGIPKGNKTKTALILDKLLNCSINEIKSFLIGVINGDGSISNRKSGGIIDIICGNKANAYLYQKLFRKIGVISRVSEIHSKGGGIIKPGNYVVYKVSITGISDIKQMYDERLLSYKKESLVKIIDREDRSWRIPNISGLLKKLHDAIPWFEKNMMYANSIRLSRINKDTSISRASLFNYIQDLEVCNPANKTQEYDELKKILDNKIIFPKIKKITKLSSKKEMYNLQLDKKEAPNFIANFLLVHNCLIDEMDKMSEEDTAAMHEALEGQTITISKANIQATLRAETTVLAAANPKLGRFDPYDILAKQIAMPPP
ncbi:hypothetical protein HYU06_06705 [Candidatus Woesearchaeota archaeon]|nr:hypothetical protein [Candidatus Woesearchaeota archaeon]